MKNLNPENIKVFSDGEWIQAKEIVIKNYRLFIALVDGQVFECNIDKVIDSEQED